ncbi:hypothetical protein BFV93_4785 [Alteromonas macleodii]|nr:hypothetical protein BFV93_4785 [Alteromonas macleodii]
MAPNALQVNVKHQYTRDKHMSWTHQAQSCVLDALLTLRAITAVGD